MRRNREPRDHAWLRMRKARCGAYGFASNQFVVDLPAFVFVDKIDGDQTILFFAGLITSLRSQHFQDRLVAGCVSRLSDQLGSHGQTFFKVRDPGHVFIERFQAIVCMIFSKLIHLGAAVYGLVPLLLPVQLDGVRTPIDGEKLVFQGDGGLFLVRASAALRSGDRKGGR